MLSMFKFVDILFCCLTWLHVRTRHDPASFILKSDEIHSMSAEDVVSLLAFENTVPTVSHCFGRDKFQGSVVVSWPSMLDAAEALKRIKEDAEDEFSSVEVLPCPLDADLHGGAGIDTVWGWQKGVQFGQKGCCQQTLIETFAAFTLPWKQEDLLRLKHSLRGGLFLYLAMSHGSLFNWCLRGFVFQRVGIPDPTSMLSIRTPVLDADTSIIFASPLWWQTVFPSLLLGVIWVILFPIHLTRLVTSRRSKALALDEEDEARKRFEFKYKLLYSRFQPHLP